MSIYKQEIIDELDEIELQINWDPHLADVVHELDEEVVEVNDDIIEDVERVVVLWIN